VGRRTLCVNRYSTIATESYETQALIEASDDERKGSLNAIGMTCETLSTPLCGGGDLGFDGNKSACHEGCAMTSTKSTSRQ
jgi:hypothetical protein